MVAGASLSGAVLFYFQYRKKVLLYYGLMLLVPTVLLVHRITELYCGAIAHCDAAWIPTVLSAIEKSAFSLGMFVGPFFMHLVLGISLSRPRKTSYIAVACMYTFLAGMEIAFKAFPIGQLLKNALSMPLLFGMYGYCLVMGAVNLGKMGSPFLKRVVLGLLCISCIILPFSLLQYFMQKPYLPGFMEQPLLFIALFALTLFFLVNHFNHPAYFAGTKLTDYFKEKFSITEREGDIIFHVIHGHSNQVIGEKLCISIRTVESHLYSIFQKLGIKNRVQLVNLIQTNKN
jgi:DNA-binding CsgD family transcriptional regulator